jgi:hypothetical protein
MDMGHRTAMAGDDHFFACLHLVQQFAQMGLRLNQIDRDHGFHNMTRKQVISKRFSRQWQYSRRILTRIGESRCVTEERAGASTRTSRVIGARPEELYAAFLDATALADGLPPVEMKGEIHELDARVGGGYRMSRAWVSLIGCMNSSTRTSPTVAGLRFVISMVRLICRCGRRDRCLCLPTAAILPEEQPPLIVDADRVEVLREAGSPCSAIRETTGV